jgi:tetratricopeptide (TPR) repeat protein
MSNEELGKQTELTLKLIDQVDQLITQGKIKEAMEIIEGREKEEGLEELRWGILECKGRNIKGEYKQVIELITQLIKKLEEPEEPVEEKTRKRIRIDALIEQVRALQSLGQLDEGLEKVEEGIRLVKELEELEELETQNKDKERKVKLLITKGLIYLLKGELDKAAKYFKKNLAISKELGNKELIADSLINVGRTFFVKGDLDEAHENWEKSLVIAEELGNKIGIGNSLNNIGVIYQQKGELVHALEYYEKSLVMREEVGNRQLISNSLNNIGMVHHELGALEEALDFFKQCLVMNEEIGAKQNIANSLFELIDVTINLDEIEQARNYLSDLQLINEQEENKFIDLWSKLAKALILKTSKRRKNLTKAEEMLEEIVKEEFHFEATVHALVNLSELLLEELRLTGEEEVLEEVEEKVEKLLEMAKKQQSYTLLAKSYWLKAQIALVRLDIKEARTLLSQAQIIAEEKGLERLARKISSEHDQLLQQLDQWEELIAKDASITERVKVANLEELVGWMARKREIKIDEKEDEPIMLLLVSESGLPIYSNKFDQTKELQDMLISGFLTSINFFVQEAFEVTGMIKRITHDEYTLSFDLKEPILFCYVYEGQSYTAMKKLEKLITEVHESEVWSALEKVSKRGYGLNNREKNQMEGMIEKIFVTN